MPGNFHSVPESVLATWPAPNYVNPVSRNWLPAVAYTLTAVGTVLLANRFFLRARKDAAGFGLDDFFIFMGWLFSVGLTACAVIDTQRFKISRHTWDVPPEDYVGAALTGWIAQVIFLFSTCATKASVLLFYRRMACESSQRMMFAIYIALAFTAALFVGVLITYCLICQPLSAYWLSYNFSYHQDFKCIDGDVLNIFLGVLSVISDIYAVMLPCIWLQRYHLDISRRQRLGLNILFSLGTIVAGCGVARTYYLWQINNTYDTSWAGFNLFLWALLECHLAIIFACAPALRAFLRRYLVDTVKSSRAMSRQRRGGTPDWSAKRNSSGPGASDPEKSSGATESVIEQRGLTLASPTLTSPTIQLGRSSTWSTRSRSSETVPRTNITSPDEYEQYVLEQLGRYTLELRRNGTARLSVISGDMEVDRPWEANDDPGLFTRTYSRDSESGESKA